MKRLFYLSFLIVTVIAFSGCDDRTMGVVKPAIEEVIDEQPAEPGMPAEVPTDINYADLPLIDSADLESGLYRMNVEEEPAVEIGETETPPNKVYAIFTSTLEENVYVWVRLHQVVEDLYYTHLFGAEVVVQIHTKDSVNNDHSYKGIYHVYDGTIIKILKQPEEGGIDYEYQPTGYEDLPILEEASASGDVQLGQYRMFADGLSISEHKINYVYSETTEENVDIRVFLNPRPWSVTIEDRSVINPHHNILVVEITKNLGVKTETETQIRSTKTFTYHDFEGILIKNISAPHIPIEYEEDATE